MAALGHHVTSVLTVVAPDLIYHSIDHGPKQILTCGSDSACLAEIWKFQSL